MVTTILGSCVSVCLWDSKLRIGGINHYLLPHGSDGDRSSERFGDVAIRILIEKLLTLGSTKRNLVAKLFGGACLLEDMEDARKYVGEKNVEVARRLLEEEKIPLVGEDVGGRCARKIIYRSEDGAAWVKRIGKEERGGY